MGDAEILRVSLGVIVALVGIIGYMIKKSNKKSNNPGNSGKRPWIEDKVNQQGELLAAHVECLKNLTEGLKEQRQATKEFRAEVKADFVRVFQKLDKLNGG